MKTFTRSFRILTLTASLGLGGIGSVALGQELETVATFPLETPPGNLAIAPSGRTFMSVHGFYGTPAARIVEVAEDGSTSAYPNEDWVSTTEGQSFRLGEILGVRVDQNHVLWMLEGLNESKNGRLVGWDTKNEKLHKVYHLCPPVVTEDSFLNDIAVDLDHSKVFIADSAGAIIILDLETGMARRVLDGSVKTTPEDIDMVIEGKVVNLGPQPARVGINPITIDPKNEWLYFGAMSGETLYRVATTDLLNEALTDAELEGKVESYGSKPISDGSTVDAEGNVYITSVTDHSIGVLTAEGDYKTLFQDESLAWPDGFSVGSDGMIYATINELFRSPVLNGGKAEPKGIFKIVKFKPLAPVELGR